MQIIVPMSGTGSRFKRAGYRDLKPLIDVDGMPMVGHVINMFPGEEDFLFICTREALAETPLRSVLQRLKPSGRIAEIDAHKLGPVHAVLQASEHVRRDQPVVVNYCDFSVEWGYRDFKKKMEQLDCAGCITAYRGFHPHTLGPNLYAYLRHRDNYLLEIAEKRCFTDNRMQEYASSGTYYFRSGELMLHYYQKAVAQNLQVNGEFYSSLPYNLLVEDGLPVYIYELQRFFQWGTPEDLEEYLSWSRYFREFENWRPSRLQLPGTNLIPMAGAGARFAKEGYPSPKPIIPVDGTTLVERSLECLPRLAKWVAVCQGDHLNNGRLAGTLKGISSTFTTIRAEGLTAGQLSSCLLAREHLDPDAPLLIAPCDSAAVYDEDLFLHLTADRNTDCLVWTFSNHPHANRNPKQYGWVIANPQGMVQDVQCKQIPSTPVAETPGIIGTFWFHKAKYFLEAADRLVQENRRINREFYVDSSIKVLLEQGRRARIFPIKRYLCLGTPDDVRTYEYWAGYFRSQRKALGAWA
jgi:bifunctional N-acetylglucosamine-1-phosphate-uridyltransferase/glucosamine-1-phosphate-acetyltransferase GlmU-like protein